MDGRQRSGCYLAVIATTLLIFLAPSLCHGAQAPATAAIPARIAVVSFQVAVAQTAEGQREFAALSKKYEPKQNALKSLNGEIETLTKQLQAQSNNLSDAERANRSRIIDDKKKELDREAKEAQDDFQKDMQDVYNGLASKVFDVMQSLAKQQGFTMILDVKGDQPAVLYASTGTDITKQVIEAYNLKSGDSAAAASPASTPSRQGGGDHLSNRSRPDQRIPARIR